MSGLEFVTERGFIFRCELRDLSEPVVVSGGLYRTNPQTIMEAVTEFIGWYGLEVYPTLNGFCGWDTVRYRFE